MTLFKGIFIGEGRTEHAVYENCHNKVFADSGHIPSLVKYSSSEFEAEIKECFKGEIEFLIFFDPTDAKAPMAATFTNNEQFTGAFYCFLKVNGEFLDLGRDEFNNYYVELVKFRSKIEKKPIIRKAILVRPSELEPIVEISIPDNDFTKYWSRFDKGESHVAGRTGVSTGNFSVSSISTKAKNSRFNPRASNYDSFRDHWGMVIFVKTDGGDMTMADFEKFQQCAFKEESIFTQAEIGMIWSAYNKHEHRNLYPTEYEIENINNRDAKVTLYIRAHAFLEKYNTFFYNLAGKGVIEIRQAFKDGNMDIPENVQSILNRPRPVKFINTEPIKAYQTIGLVDALSYVIKMAIQTNPDIEKQFTNIPPMTYAQMILKDDIETYFKGQNSQCY